MRDATKLALGLGAVGLLAAGAAGAASSAPRRVRREVKPSVYAREHAQQLAQRAMGPLGAALRDFVPRVWSGVPISAVLGFTAIGGADEDTCGAPDQEFHEVGEFQTPAGLCSGPAPNPDPRAPWNQWGAAANTSFVRGLLGRPATMVAGGWRGAAATRDRAAVGLYNLLAGLRAFSSDSRRELRRVRRERAQLAPRELGGQWAAACAFAAFSAGPAGAARAWSRYVDELAPLDERARFAALIRAVARDVAAGVSFQPPANHPNPAHTTLRTWQKLAAGAALEAAGGGVASAWYVLPTEVELEAAVVRGAQGT